MNYKKYEITDIQHPDASDLYRIRALRDIPLRRVQEGDLGGYVESESNLSHEGECWIGGDAIVRGGATVSERAYVSGRAYVLGDARVSGKAVVDGDAILTFGACMSGPSMLSGHSYLTSFPTKEFPPPKKTRIKLTNGDSSQFIEISRMSFSVNELTDALNALGTGWKVTTV